MKKENWFLRVFKKILMKIHILELREIDKSDMCIRSVESGVCPKNCEICAWSVNGGTE